MSSRDPEKKKKPRPGHSIADHALGALASHVHAPGEEHDHDHDHDGMELFAGDASDEVALVSIGVDIGSSGTQIAFARLMPELAPSRAGGEGGQEESVTNARRLEIGRRETLYQSPVYLTPFVEGDRIDDVALGLLVDHAFAGAGLTADDVDCGVVILTGAARERDNAQAIGAKLAETCGDIVSASAGHHLEARLAAHGSGAVARSAEFGLRLLNVDIGGATTKLAVCEGGRVIATAALAIGGRLVATDKADMIVRLEPSGQRHAAAAGLAWEKGGLAPWPERQAVARRMADLLTSALADLQGNGGGGSTAAGLYLTAPLPETGAIDGVIVSGGVGEYVYGREQRSFGDLGLPLGRALAAHIDRGALQWPLIPAAECIRATVLGASSHSVQLSGRTGYISNPATLLPRRNLPVVQPKLPLESTIDATKIAQEIEARLTDAGLGDDETAEAVLAVHWHGEPEHARLLALAEGIKRGCRQRVAAGLPLFVIADADIAGSLGSILRDEAGIVGDLLVLDGIALADLDYVDLGRIRLPSGTVPVTIKTLVFRDDREQSPPRFKPGNRGKRR